MIKLVPIFYASQVWIYRLRYFLLRLILYLLNHKKSSWFRFLLHLPHLYQIRPQMELLSLAYLLFLELIFSFIYR